MNNIGLKEIGDIAACVNHYEETINYFSQLQSDDKAKLTEYWDKRIQPIGGRDLLRYWKEINLHLVNQTWGNTSGGWEGIGGAAMSTRYTLVIENNWFGFAYIYYGGQLAYVCEMDERYKEYKDQSYRALPGRRSCRELLNVLSYKKEVE